MSENPNKVDQLLAQRGQNYGPSWRTATEAISAMTEGDASRLQGLMDNGTLANWMMIVSKLCRLVQTPSFQDSWDDIEGYAKLSADHIESLNAGKDHPNADPTSPQ